MKVCEQFIAGLELVFAIMNYIYKTLFFSGYTNVRTLSILGLQSIELQLLRNICQDFSHRELLARSGKADNALVVGKDQELEYSRHGGVTLLHPSSAFGRNVSKFPAITRCWRKEGFFTELCKLFVLFHNLEAQCAS